jgi:hypothetical protein
MMPRGGMSSGMIHLGTWRQRLLPLLTERAVIRGMTENHDPG